MIGSEPWVSLGRLGDGQFGSQVLSRQAVYPDIPLMVPRTPSLNLNVDLGLGRDAAYPGKDSPSWFARPETWVIEHSLPGACPAPAVVAKKFLRGVLLMCQEWVKKGSNGFIHAQLYRNGLPSCLQDAFTTLSAYVSRTPATEDLVLQIVEDRANSLLTQPIPGEDQRANTIAHLSRVQALLIYQVIRLLDGCVRQRALAEGIIPVLFSWGHEMWDSAKTLYVSHRAAKSSIPDGQDGFNARAELWRSWILLESVRRTWLAMAFTQNVYLIMKDGWAECSGSVSFTARKGLWEANSAAKWTDLCQSKDPWMVPALRGERLFSHDQMDDVDEFGCHLWIIIGAVDKVQSWLDRSQKRLGVVLV